MASVVVIPSPRVPVNVWTPAIAAALTHIKAQGIDSVNVLGDNVPAAAAWTNNPTRPQSITFRTVTTDWTAEQNIRTRNETLLANAAYVVVLGYVQTSSAAHVLARIFADPALHVVQVIDGKAAVVGAKTIKAAPNVTLASPRTAGPREADVWAGFTQPAAPPKAKK